MLQASAGGVYFFVGGKRVREGRITRATSAMRLQLQAYPLREHACTSEWLRPCSYEHRDRALLRQRPRTMQRDFPGRQQAGASAAIQRRHEQRIHFLRRSSSRAGSVSHHGPALQLADKTQPLGRTAALRLLASTITAYMQRAEHILAISAAPP